MAAPTRLTKVGVGTTFVSHATFWAGCWTHTVHYPAHNERGGSPPPSVTATHAERDASEPRCAPPASTLRPQSDSGTQGTVPSVPLPVQARPTGFRWAYMRLGVRCDSGDSPPGRYRALVTTTLGGLRVSARTPVAKLPGS
jgi:hypothetical protein